MPYKKFTLTPLRDGFILIDKIEVFLKSFESIKILSVFKKYDSVFV